MKNRRWMKWVACAVYVCGLLFSAQARKKEVTLVLVPREDASQQLGLDLANRYSILLVTYKVAPNGVVSLHGWTGSQWVNITLADYQAGNFFKKNPGSALIVEKEGETVPQKIVPPKTWCTDVSKITTTRVRPLIHLTGQYFDFNHRDWAWFANRYNQKIEAINPEGLNTAWFHKRLGDHLKSGTPAGANDLQYWKSLRKSVVAEPILAVATTEAGASEAIEPGVENELPDPFADPVPPAIVMGAGNVPEERMINANGGKAENEDDEK